MLTTLFVDFNAFFASVEQQLRPELRGRPVAVVPVVTQSGCCIATSYEAKAFGVKTGTRVAEALERCPEIALVRSRPREYVRVHHVAMEAIGTCLPVRKAHSIDEASCALGRGQRAPAEARALALRVKEAITARAGECLRSSIGIAPNVFLAKVATELEKPDGLVVVRREDLPRALYGLELRDLPGIGARMEARLAEQGVTTVRELCARSEEEMERLWGSVVGRRWWLWLRGEETEAVRTVTRSVGHEHVLPPELRGDREARAVAMRLLSRAAARARHIDRRPTHLTLFVRLEVGERWAQRAAIGDGCGDTLSMMETLDALWARRPAGEVKQVRVSLEGLRARGSATLPLFEAERKRDALSEVIGKIAARHGANRVHTAAIHGSLDAAPGGIAFGSVPDLSMPDALGEDRQSNE